MLVTAEHCTAKVPTAAVDEVLVICETEDVEDRYSWLNDVLYDDLPLAAQQLRTTKAELPLTTVCGTSKSWTAGKLKLEAAGSPTRDRFGAEAAVMAEDLGAKFVRINAAKKAAADLRALSSGCKTAFLREEGALFANEALDVVKTIEDMTLDYNCSLLDETIGKAALRAEDVLRVLAGRIAAADRQAKPNLLGLIGRQLSNPHKQMFKDARDSLRQVLPMMTEVAADLTDSDSGDAAQQPQLQEQLSQNSGSSSELRLYYQGNNKVCTIALTPGPSGNVASSTLWVGLKQKVEFFVGCNASNKHEVLTEKGQGVTCAIGDGLGGVYTGHAHGVVKLHHSGTWEAAQHPSSVGLPVRSMAVDSRGFCWVGDEAGIIRVLMLDPQNGQLNLKVQLAPPQAQGLLNLAMRFGPTAAANAFKESMSSSSNSSLVRLGSGSSSTSTVRAAPIAAMCSKGLAVFSTGGKSPYNITVWHSQKFSELEVSTCESFGATCSFAILPWEAPSAATGVSGASRGAPPPQGDNSTAVAGIPATGIAVGYATVQPRATVPARIMKHSLAKQAAGAAGSASSSAADTSDYSSWRLLSAHERGQVLLWQFNGVTRSAGTTKLLQLLSVIGEPRPQYAVRGMAVFDDLSMLALVHANGELTAMPMPKWNNLPVSSNSSGASFSAVGVPAGGSGVVFGAASLHHWNPRVAHIKAHKSPVVATACLGELLVTATSGTVQSWTAERLKLEAQVDGLMFSRKNKAYSTGSTAAALEAAISAADDCTSSGSVAPVSPSRVAADRADASVVAGVDQDEGSRAPRRRQQQRNGQAEGGATRAGVAPVAAGPVPASCKAANPMSRESVMARGLQVDATNKVVVKPHAELSAFPMMSPHLPNGMPGYSLPGPNRQVLPASAGHQTPGRRPEHSPRGGALDTVGSSGGLEASLSSFNSEGIKPHQVICNSELVLKEVIGSGAEGKVYRGTWTNIDIAAKEYSGVDDDDADSTVANSETSSEAAMQRARNALRKEVALLMCFNHPNLVRFCGVCLDPPLVVMEFYKHGNVFQMIEKARRQWVNNQARPGAPTPKQATKYMNYFTWDRRLEMLHDVSAGMMYLHKRHYIHGDLRSPNLFVGLDGRVKIGDFGFTKRLNSQQRSMQVKRITHPRWVAPELMTDYRLSAESDVYSFGIIMYEMLTWQLPFYDLTKEQVVYHLMGGSRPDIPVDEQLPPGTSSSTCLGNYIKLMQECWDQDTAKRPPFERIAARLKAMIRWRMVIQRNRVLARVAAKLKAAGQAHRAVPVPPPAIIAVTDAPVVMDAAGPVAAGTPAAAQEVLQMSAPAAPAAVSAFASSPPVPEVAVRTIDEEDHEPLPRPEHPIVQVPDLVGEANIESSAVEPPIIPVARARTAPASAVAHIIDEAAEEAEADAKVDADTTAAPPAGEEATPGEQGQLDLQQNTPRASRQVPAAPQAVAATDQQQVDRDSPFSAHAVRPRAARALVRRQSSGRRSDVSLIGPNGERLIVGSDVPESPCSQCTLSTKASNDAAGLSTTTDGGATMGLSTPTTSMLMAMPEWKGSGLYELQASKSCEATKPTPPSPVRSPQPAAPSATATVEAEQPGSPRPPGYPLVDSAATVAQAQLVSTKPRVAFDDGPFAMAPIEAGEKAPAAPVAVPAGSMTAANSSVLAPASASTKLDTIQESSESASGTASGTVSSGALGSRGPGGGAVPGAFGSFSHAGSADAAGAAGTHPVASMVGTSAAPLHAPLPPVLEDRSASDTTTMPAQSVSQQQNDLGHTLSAEDLGRRRSSNSNAAECRVTSWLQQTEPVAPEPSAPCKGFAAAAGVTGSSVQQHQQAQQRQLQNRQLESDVTPPAAAAAAAGTAAAELPKVDSGGSPFLRDAVAEALTVQPLSGQAGTPQQPQIPPQQPSAATASAGSVVSAATPPADFPRAAVSALDSAASDAGPFGLPIASQQPAQQEQELQSIDHFTAQDSPFFQNFGPAADSGSVHLGSLFGAAAAAGAGPAASQPLQPGLQAHMSAAHYLDDSVLPMEDDEPRLGAAITVVYPEGQAVVDAAVGSHCMLKNILQQQHQHQQFSPPQQYPITQQVQALRQQPQSQMVPQQQVAGAAPAQQQQARLQQAAAAQSGVAPSQQQAARLQRLPAQRQYQQQMQQQPMQQQQMQQQQQQFSAPQQYPTSQQVQLLRQQPQPQIVPQQQVAAAVPGTAPAQQQHAVLQQAAAEQPGVAPSQQQAAGLLRLPAQTMYMRPHQHPAAVAAMASSQATQAAGGWRVFWGMLVRNKSGSRISGGSGLLPSSSSQCSQPRSAPPVHTRVVGPRGITSDVEDVAVNVDAATDTVVIHDRVGPDMHESRLQLAMAALNSNDTASTVTEGKTLLKKPCIVKLLCAFQAAPKARFVSAVISIKLKQPPGSTFLDLAPLSVTAKEGVKITANRKGCFEVSITPPQPAPGTGKLTYEQGKSMEYVQYNCHLYGIGVGTNEAVWIFKEDKNIQGGLENGTRHPLCFTVPTPGSYTCHVLAYAKLHYEGAFFKMKLRKEVNVSFVAQPVKTPTTDDADTSDLL